VPALENTVIDYVGYEADARVWVVTDRLRNNLIRDFLINIASHGSFF
jgi:hypothetical protein